MKSLCIVVVGTLAGNPYAGMAWMHMQIAEGLRRLGHDVYYIEATSSWPYDPVRQMKVNDSDYAVPYLARVAESFGFGDRWGYRRSYSDKEWLGMSRSKAEDLLAHADAVLNISGSTRFAVEGLKTSRLVYVGTDPVYHEITLAKGDDDVRTLIEEHDDCITSGENIGSKECLIPPLPRLRSKARQPVLLDLWKCDTCPRQEFTTVCNWQQAGRDIEFHGQTYYWSKHWEFLKFIDLPRRVKQPIELATSLASAPGMIPAVGDAVSAVGMNPEVQSLLTNNGWKLSDAHAFTTDPWRYRDYIQSSRGEFTVAKDENVRLRSGWFSERSACYLAAGRPVITQDTGFGSILPTGEGLFAFSTMDDILAAFDAVNTNYERHSRAARAIAEQYFCAETVLANALGDIGF
jgi:hypothetical protein